MGDYFHKPLEDPVNLDGRSQNSPSVMEALEELMRKLVTERFYAPGAPLSELRDGPQGRGTLEELAGALWQFSSVGHFKKIWKQCISLRPDAAVEAFIKIARGKDAGGIPHPDYPSLDILDLAALRSEFHVLYDVPEEGQNPNCGLFAVIRESRGPVAPEGQSYTLAREVLWVAPKSRIIEPDKHHPGFYGFYVSASDQDVFLIESLLPENGTIILNGTARGAEGTQRFTLIFEAFQRKRKLQYAHGVLAGIAAGGASDKPSIGAWRTVVIRPDWDLGLDRLLYDCQKTQASKVRGIVSDKRFAAVLSSGDSFQRERLAFRRLIANEQRLVSKAAEKFEGFLLDEIEKRIRKSGTSARAGQKTDTKNLVRTVVGIIQEQWHVLDPAQLVNFGAHPRAGQEADVKKLLELDSSSLPA